MPVVVEALDDNRSILVSYSEPYQPVDDVIASLEQELIILRGMSDFPAYIIVDISKVEMSFSDIVHGLGAVTQSDIGKEVAQYDLRILHIGSGDMVEMGADGLRQAQYGANDVVLFESIEAAVAYVKDQVETQAAAQTMKNKKATV